MPEPITRKSTSFIIVKIIWFQNTKVTKKEYSISERSSEIKNILKKKKKVNFEELFEQYNKDYVVVTFLSILTMAKKQELVIEQANNFDKIIISLKGSE